MLAFNIIFFLFSIALYSLWSSSLILRTLTRFSNWYVAGLYFLTSLGFTSLVYIYVWASAGLTLYTTPLSAVTTPSLNLWIVFPFIYIFIIVTLLTTLYLVAYNKSELSIFFLYLSSVFISGFGLFASDSFLSFFLFYELLLIPSFFILYNYAKTRKAIEAAFLMFFWTQVGAMCLFFFFISMYLLTTSTLFTTLPTCLVSEFHQTINIVLLLIGFGVKFPIWPFYEWLPKAHVESSTNFSIFLSGVLVKFAFFGFFRCLFHLESNFSLLIPYIWLVVGIGDVAMKLYYQIDLKKLIAYATTVEMHWLSLALLNGQTVFWYSVYAMLVSHAFLSSNFFFAIDSVTRRYKTRLTTEVSGLFILTPKLYLSTLILLITFLGFPGSLFFIAEFLFFAYLTDISLLLVLLLLFILYFFVISCYFKNWFYMLFGYSVTLTQRRLLNDLDTREFILFSFLTALVYILGAFNTYIF